MKTNDGAYHGFEKDLDVEEAIECTSAGTEADTYDKYIGTELQLPNKDGMKWMERVCQILSDEDVNTEGTGNYGAQEDHTDYEIKFCDE